MPATSAFPHPFIPSPGPAHTAKPAQKLGVNLFCGLKMRFFCLPKIFLFFASVFSRKNCENHGFWPPKTFPKSIQNASKIDVSKNMRFFMDFCWFLVACCKSRTSNFMRPAIVLLIFHTSQRFAIGTYFWSKKPTKNLPKTKSEPFKNRCKKRVVFQHRFFRVSGSILEPLGLPRWNQIGSQSFLRVCSTAFFLLS